MSTTINKIGVIGAGAWGTALAKHLAENGLEIRLWAYEQDVVNSINTSHENSVFLKDVRLPPSLTATSSLAEAVLGCDGILFAVPSHITRSVLRQLTPCFSTPVPLVCATKGIEEQTAKLMTQVLEDELPPFMHRSLMVLSGPSFASEFSAGKPTAVCLAGHDEELVRRFQRAMMTSVFRVYADTDIIGVQLGGALKNVMALAAGVIDGLDLGLNARAALITRGLAEIIRLGAAMGADPRTFYGLSGVGDLILTCTGALSRNHAVGVRLGKGEPLESIMSGMQAVAEGIRTSRAALTLARRHHIDMPITQEINAVLYDAKSCQSAVRDLMERDAKSEKGWT